MCICPVTLKVKPNKYSSCLKGGSRQVLVPCGHCIECLRSKQNEWFVRLFTEFKDSECQFFTLTYRNDALPYNVDN